MQASPVKLLLCVVDELEGCIYACGGCRENFVSAALSMMDPRTWAWSSLPTMPATTGAAMTLSRMYVPGGRSPPRDVASLHCYDLDAGRWDTCCAPMSVIRLGHGVAALQGEVWALGGQAGIFTALASVEVYSPRLNSWRAGEALPHSWYDGACSMVQC